MAGKKQFVRLWIQDVDDGYFRDWTRGEVLLWLVLKCRADRHGKCFPAYAHIIERTGLSRACIQRAIKALEDRGVISVERGRRADKQKAVNRYTFHDSKRA